MEQKSKWPDYSAATAEWDNLVPKLAKPWHEINYEGDRRPLLTYTTKADYGGVAITSSAKFKVYLDGSSYFEEETTTHSSLQAAIDYVEAEIGEEQ